MLINYLKSLLKKYREQQSKRIEQARRQQSIQVAKERDTYMRCYLSLLLTEYEAIYNANIFSSHIKALDIKMIKKKETLKESRHAFKAPVLNDTTVIDTVKLRYGLINVHEGVLNKIQNEYYEINKDIADVRSKINDITLRLNGTDYYAQYNLYMRLCVRIDELNTSLEKLIGDLDAKQRFYYFCLNIKIFKLRYIESYPYIAICLQIKKA